MLRKVTDVTKYQQVIGSLIYLMTCTRPCISYSVGILSSFMKKPRELHWRFLKRLFKYVKSTKDYRTVNQLRDIYCVLNVVYCLIIFHRRKVYCPIKCSKGSIMAKIIIK